jgi:hypothetical protein
MTQNKYILKDVNPFNSLHPYLKAKEQGYISVRSEDEATQFESWDEANDIRKTLLNKQDFFIVIK